jgi:hypothetical protein
MSGRTKGPKRPVRIVPRSLFATLTGASVIPLFLGASDCGAFGASVACIGCVIEEPDAGDAGDARPEAAKLHDAGDAGDAHAHSHD